MAHARMRRRGRGVAVPALAALLLGSAAAGNVSAQAPSPTLEGPITEPGTPFIAATTIDLAQIGYMQEEYFISGTATAYTSATPLTSDGMWTATPGATAAYKTRVLVNRPSNRRKFNGTVVVEWLNVSGGLDAAPDWIMIHTALIRDGFAWMGVSAQYAGVEGGGGLVNVIEAPLKMVNPARYGALAHPGDSFSYDIFSQAGQAIRRPAAASPLGDLKVKKVIAAGESQSAFRMVTYVDAIHPLAHVYDGFLVHSRGAGGLIGANLSEPPQPNIAVPSPTFIRSDIDVPVLTFQTETDVTLLGSTAARQPDTDRVRLWEVAGTAHADAYFTLAGMTDLGDSPDVVELVVTSAPVPGIITCDTPINSGPQHFVAKAAIVALNRWVRRGTPPKPAPRLEVDAGPPVRVQHDAHGNALGGIRTPQVDVPIAAFGGEQGGALICRLFGTTTPFDAATLAALYPTHGAFVSAYNKALKRSVRGRFLLKPDAKLMKRWAAGSDVGG